MNDNRMKILADRLNQLDPTAQCIGQLRQDDERCVEVVMAGNGDRFGLISIEGSGQVVVFHQKDGVWRGCCEFNNYESTGCVPGEALDEIAHELDAVSERRESPREATERRTHRRIHDWEDHARDDRRIT